MQVKYSDHYTEVLRQVITSQLCKTYNNCVVVKHDIYIYIYIYTRNNFPLFILCQLLNSCQAGYSSYLFGCVVWPGSFEWICIA